jgi:hypothetical protein
MVEMTNKPKRRLSAYNMLFAAITRELPKVLAP